MKELRFPDKAVQENPIRLVSSEIGGKLFVEAGASTRPQLIIDQDSDFSSEIKLGPGACVQLFIIQSPRLGKSVTSSNRFYLKRHSDLEVLSFSHGLASARNAYEVFFEEEHGFCSLKGLSLLEGDSQVAHQAIVHHQAPHCTSRQFYKNILTDKARSDFNSLVFVHRGAKKSDSRQLNRNLLLSNGSRAYSKPELRIDDDDVACTHGATAGQLEETELFYLRSRGLSDREARFILTYGFAEELIEALSIPTLKSDLEKVTVAQIERMAGRK